MSAPSPSAPAAVSGLPEDAQAPRPARTEDDWPADSRERKIAEGKAKFLGTAGKRRTRERAPASLADICSSEYPSMDVLTQKVLAALPEHLLSRAKQARPAGIPATAEPSPAPDGAEEPPFSGLPNTQSPAAAPPPGPAEKPRPAGPAAWPGNDAVGGERGPPPGAAPRNGVAHSTPVTAGNAGAPEIVCAPPATARARLAAEGPWADPGATSLVASLRAAPWKAVDIETTGLTPASKPVKVTRKMLLAGADPTLRTRIITAAWCDPTIGGDGIRTEAWDLDTASPSERQALAAAALSGVLIGHNLAFDLSWLLLLAPGGAPTAVLDTMLITRLARPTAAVDLLIEAATGETAKSIAKRTGGWSLEALTWRFLAVRMDKSYQKPQNWVPPPPLSQEHYDYAAGDATGVLKLLRCVLGAAADTDPLEAWHGWLADQNPEIQEHARVYARLPLHLARMTRRGVPISRETCDAYVAAAKVDAAEKASVLAQIEPGLSPCVSRLSDPTKGMDEKTKAALCAAFEARGVRVARTKKAGAPQVGEKDLRGARADQGEAAPLFEALAVCNRATRRAAMASALRESVERSDSGFGADGIGRVHSLFSPSTGTGRLTSSEPNLQNLPRDAEFRAIVRARPGRMIISCDYSAIDVRIGAALAIREQRRIALAMANPAYLNRWYGDNAQLLCNAVAATPDACEATLQVARHRLDQAREIGRAQGEWGGYRSGTVDLRIAQFALALHRLLILYGDGDFDAAWRVFRALGEEGARHWAGESAFRRAFRLGADVHTYTTLKFDGRDSEAAATGLEGAAIKAHFERLKDELGPKRQRGKIANLSLLYGMTPPSFQVHAAKVYGVHMSLAEAEETTGLWYAAYPEIDLLGASTALRGAERWGDGEFCRNSPFGESKNGLMRVYDSKQDRVRVKPVWLDTTLDLRPIAAAGLNSAINYPDQGTGAGILNRVLDVFATDHPDLYASVVDQVHDELVFEISEDAAEDAARRIREVMEREGDRVLQPYGVPMTAAVTVGRVWTH